MSDQPTTGAFPFLTYQDPAKAIEWLTEVFGFEAMNVTTTPDGSVMHAELRTQNGVVLLTPADGGGVLPMRSPRDLPFTNQGIYIHIAEAADVDSHHDRARAGGAAILLALDTKPWGSREYTCTDLEGHIWSFGTYRP